MPKNTAPMPDWELVLSSAARLQRILPDAVLVGGTASAIHAEHRFSRDADHVLTDLRQRFVKCRPNWNPLLAGKPLAYNAQYNFLAASTVLKPEFASLSVMNRWKRRSSTTTVRESLFRPKARFCASRGQERLQVHKLSSR